MKISLSPPLSATKPDSSAKYAPESIHPGQYVRESVLIPKKLSVVAAAKLVGVGRPALSNFLNGHVSATPDMASRIEVAFGLPAQRLLDMQAVYDATQTKAKGAPANAMPYVAPFLSIKATDIEAWIVRNIPARTRLSVLLRTVVNSTCSGISKIDFPGNDDAERPGWDGHIETTQATPWIPEGISGWEFGTNQDIKSKADGDFIKSVRGTGNAERSQTTFVFVTPRHWPGKADWVNEKKAERQWRDVRAYDSSDLEQWLEQSIAGQTWFANETLRPSKGVRSLDKCWADWADVASPPLAESLFTPAIDGAKRAMLSRLSTMAGEPIVIAADSVEEALAFLAHLFGPAGGDEFARLRERVLVFGEPSVLPILAQGTKDFIVVAANRKVEVELGPVATSMLTVVIYPRNAANASPCVILEPLTYDAFRSSLAGMGYGPDDITKYSNESGRSLTVLRRRLASVPAVRTPEWAADHETAARLIPFLFIGAWNSTNSTDQTVLTLLTNEEPYEILEKACQRLAGLNDAPLWSVGTYRGVISKIDLLFAIAGSITSSDLQRYFDLAKLVLSEDDPKLDLPESDRWAAAIHGKSREFSSTMREGMSETLVLLAVYGNDLFRNRLGFDCELAVKRLVEYLLKPIKTRILEANQRDLAAYAEAAPDTFLSILEDDLRSAHPETYGLMRPVDTGIFGGGCARSGLLWALEGLSWNPDTLLRAALVLAQLAEIEINDNWGNKPIRSLESIFRAWMPQTAADHDTRVRVIKQLAVKFPKVAWKICIRQLVTGQQVGDYSHKPRWRNEGHGYGEPFKKRAPVLAFMQEMVDMALNWNGCYTQEMLCDLIQHLHDLPAKHQTEVWHLVTSWVHAGASDADKALVREKIRVTVMSRRGAKRFKKADSLKLMDDAKITYQTLEPSDLINKHEWLFRQHWVDESADELHDEDINFEEREKRVTTLRTDALREIIESRGLSGIINLAERGNAAQQIGWLTTAELLTDEEIPAFLLTALLTVTNGQTWAKKNLIAGALRSLIDEKKCVSILRKIKQDVSDSDFVRLLVLAPFRRSTWLIVDTLDEPHRFVYWSDVAPEWIRNADEENKEAVERLLVSQRPRAAFACVHFKLASLSPELLFRLMSEMVKESKDQPGDYQLDRHLIEKAFALIDKYPALTLEQKAGLEFAYIEILSEPWSKQEGYGIPNLQKYVEEHPELFVQAIVWTYKRRDEGEDPPEFKVVPEKIQHFAKRGHELLEGLDRMPGHDEFGELQANRLAAWIKTVRDACTELGRLEIADESLGKLLSGAPVGKDGIWPCEAVRQVMEDLHSKNVINGAHTGLYNSRGVTWRGEGGAQERALAEKYRVWANALQYSHPFVAIELLLDMVKTYEHEANREDTEAGIKRRLRI